MRIVATRFSRSSPPAVSRPQAALLRQRRLRELLVELFDERFFGSLAADLGPTVSHRQRFQPAAACGRAVALVPGELLGQMLRSRCSSTMAIVRTRRHGFAASERSAPPAARPARTAAAGNTARRHRPMILRRRGFCALPGLLAREQLHGGGRLAGRTAADFGQLIDERA